MDDSSDIELELLRRRKMEEMIRERMQEQAQQQIQEQQISRELKMLTDRILTPEANERLNNIRFGMPEFARQVEIILLQLYQSGRIRQRITDDQLKEILLQIKSQERSTTITRK